MNCFWRIRFTKLTGKPAPRSVPFQPKRRGWAMVKLSPAQRFALERLPQSYMMWGLSPFTRPDDGIRIPTLEALEKRGLATVVTGAMSVEYRITEAGRAALAASPSGRAKG